VTNRIAKGDKGTKLSFKLIKPSGVPWNLTNATVTLVMAGGMPYTKITRTCVVDNPVGGDCYYILTSDDTAVSGKYKLEAVIDFGNSKYTTISQGELEIVETLS
jgi:hypothetical protein